jgi:hypothetical protein
MFLMGFGLFSILAHFMGWERAGNGTVSTTGTVVEAVFHLLPFVAGLLLFNPQAAKELLGALPRLFGKGN